MSQKMSKKSRLVLHNSTDRYNEWINFDSLSCVCFHGRQQQLQEHFGAWHSICTSGELQERSHFVSSVFLSEYIKNLCRKKSAKRQSVQQQWKAAGKDILCQFKHETCEDHFIEQYRETKMVKRRAHDENCPIEADTSEDCPTCVARETLMEPIRKASGGNIRTLPPPLVGYQGTNGVYFEPFYPALYGQAHATTRPDPNLEANGIRFPVPVAVDTVADGEQWVPENAVYRLRWLSRQSQGVCDEDLAVPVKQLGVINRRITKKKLRQLTERESVSVTNYRTDSGRPIALVRMGVAKRASIHHSVTDKYFMDNTEKEDMPNLEPFGIEDQPPKEQATGKLLQGKLRNPFIFQSIMDPQLVVQSTTFKHPQLQSPDLLHNDREEKLVKGKLKPLKQDSVKSIPNRRSSMARTELPDLEVRPASSLPVIVPPKQSNESSLEKSFILNQDNSDILLSSPTVVNHSLESKVHTPSKEKSLSALHSLRMKSTRQATISLRTWSGCAEINKRNPFLEPPVKKSFIEKDSEYFNELSRRRKIVSLRKESVPLSTGTLADEIRTEQTSRCALRSQQRQLKQRQKLLSGKRVNTLVDDVGRVCKKSSPKVKVFVKGRAKTLVDFLPTVAPDRLQMSRVLRAE